MLGILLQDLWVLSWEFNRDRLTLEIDATVNPDSPHFGPPFSVEYGYYRRARLVFEGFEKLEGLRTMEDVKFCAHPEGSRDFAIIDDLEVMDAGYRIVGDFGDVKIKGGTMRFAFDSEWPVH